MCQGPLLLFRAWGLIFPGCGRAKSREGGELECFQLDDQASNGHGTEFFPLLEAPGKCSFVVQVRFSSCPQRVQGLVGEKGSCARPDGSVFSEETDVGTCPVHVGPVETQETFPGALSPRRPTDEEKLARNVWGGESRGVGRGDQEAGASVGTVCVGGQKASEPRFSGKPCCGLGGQVALGRRSFSFVSWVLLEGLGSHSGI